MVDKNEITRINAMLDLNKRCVSDQSFASALQTCVTTGDIHGFIAVICTGPQMITGFTDEMAANQFLAMREQMGLSTQESRKNAAIIRKYFETRGGELSPWFETMLKRMEVKE